jgi:hypothetical protein
VGIALLLGAGLGFIIKDDLNDCLAAAVLGVALDFISLFYFCVYIYSKLE